MRFSKGQSVFLYIAIAAALLAAGLLTYALWAHEEETGGEPLAEFPASLALSGDAIEAQAAILYDPASGRVLFEKNANEQMPLASITKLMTAEAALASLPQNSVIAITPEAIATEGDSGLRSGEEWGIGELLRYGLLVSSNDAMAAVAGSVGKEHFLSAMNKRAHDLGLAQSYFLDPAGLDLTTGVSGAYGSARDVALLSAAFLKEYPALFQSTLRDGALFQSGGDILRAAATASPILDIAGLIGAKTGYTDLAGGNLVAVFDIELSRPLIAVVLNSSEEGRFSDIRIIAEAARDALRSTGE